MSDIENGGVSEDIKVPPAPVEYVKPTVKAAKPYLLEASPHWVDADDGNKMKPIPLGAPPSKLSVLGVGISLYFYTVRFLAIIFLLMFIISLPSIIIMIGSSPQKLTTSESLLQGLTVLTFSTLYDNVTASHADGHLRGCLDGECGVCFGTHCYTFPEEPVAILLSALDCLYTVLFLIAIAVFSRIQQRRVSSVDSATTTAADFTIQVNGIPPDVEHASEVVEFFQKYGTVTSVVLGRSDGGMIRKYRTLLARQKELERLQARDAKAHDCEKAIAKKKEVIAKLEKQISDLIDKGKATTSCAYVTFDQETSVIACRRAYSVTHICGPPKEKRFRHKYAISVQRAPEPSDIQWENLPYGAFTRFVRRVFSLFFSILIVCLAVIIVVAAKKFKEDQTAKSDVCKTIDFKYPDTKCYLPLPRPLAEDVLQQKIVNVTMLPNATYITECTRCMCNSLLTVAPDLYTQSVTVGIIGWKARFGPELGGFCTEAAKDLATFYSLQIAAILVVVLINFFAKFVMRALAKFQRHHLLSAQEAAIAIGIFFIQFINTGLIILIIFGDIEPVREKIAKASSTSGSSYVNTATAYFPIFTGSFKDITSKWYAVVGTSLMVTVLLNVVLPCIPLVLMPLKRLMARCKARKMVLQDDLNEALLGPAFGIAERYGLVLSTAFVCFMYSSGMPIMLLLGSLTFFVIYWVDKILLLRLFRTPPQYNDAMDRSVLSVLPWSSIIHLGIGVWCYSATDTFPRPALSSFIEKYSNRIQEEALRTGDDFIVQFNIAERVFNWVVFPMFIIFILVCLGLIIPKIFFFIPSCRRSNRIVPEGSPSYREAVANRTLVGLKTYEMSYNPNYKGIVLTAKSAWRESEV